MGATKLTESHFSIAIDAKEQRMNSVAPVTKIERERYQKTESADMNGMEGVVRSPTPSTWRSLV